MTGASGFIGRHVAAALERRGIPATLAGRNAPRSSFHRSVALDLKTPSADAFTLLGEPDTLIHLAWGGLPNYKSGFHVEEELPSQYTFLEPLVRAGLKNLVVSGTCVEYGMQSGSLREDFEAQPANPYAIAKDALRRRLQQLRGDTPFQLTWARLFYCYGEGQAPTSLLPQLRSAVERGDAIFNMSGGEQLRDYLPVEVVAEHLVSLATKARDHGIVNVCSGTPVSIKALVEGWIRENNWAISLRLGYYPYPDDEPMEFWGNRSKLDRLLAG